MIRLATMGPSQRDILDTLANGPMTVQGLADDLGRDVVPVHLSLSRLMVKRCVTRTGRGTRNDPHRWSITPLGRCELLRHIRAGRYPGVRRRR